MDQIITIKPDGSIFGLDHKRKGLDLREFGKASTRRETLIEWSEENQKWFIEWATGDRRSWTHQMIREQTGDEIPFEVAPDDEENLTGVLLWNDYEDAVKAEVAVIQKLQTEGRLVS